jgi:superfamily II DNA or RNA helicase
VRFIKTADELIKEGYLVRPSIYMVRTPLRPIFGKDYREVYNLGVVLNEGRNFLIKYVAELCIKQGRHTLLLVKEEKHGKELVQLLEDKYPFVTGKIAKGKRSRLMDEFREKQFPLMIATTLADEGLDIPNIRFLILAGGGKAGHLTIQRVG